MDALARQEYPGMLASLPPTQAVSLFSERVKRVGRVNAEIADWLQERRKVEELYVQGLKKLARRQPPDNQSELGIFKEPWQKIVSATEQIAASHSMLAQRIDKDVEQALRSFPAKSKEMASIGTIQGNLAHLAKEYDSAREASDKLSKKGSKANPTKVQNAALKLATATSEWESQAPFIFEKLQAVDETRLNHLRDVLTQFETHEADQVERNRITALATLNSLLEVDTAVEIHNFVANATQGKPRIERRTAVRTSSTVSAASSSLQPPTPRAPVDDGSSQHSVRNDASSEHKKEGTFKRFGTMMGRRRQSIHAGSFGRAASPSGGFTALGQPPRSRDGRPVPSPRSSSTNLRDSTRQNSSLGAVAESPRSSRQEPPPKDSHNGDGAEEAISKARSMNGESPEESGLPNIKSPPGSSLSEPNVGHPSPTQLDSEGFSVPSAFNDPISQAQQEAAEENDPGPSFKLNIKQQPIQEEDADARAALSSVANTLRSGNLATPGRKIGTVRGRRDVRNTMYIPAPDVPILEAPRSPENSSTASPPPGFYGGGRAAALAALGGEVSSSGDSIRSSTSAGGSHIKHPEMTDPGLNSSIIETVNAVFENGEVKTVSVIGELALSYVHEPSASSEIPDIASIRLDNFQALEAIAPNKAFVSEAPSAERPGEYNVSLSHIARTNCAFKYKVHIEPTGLLSHIPLLVTPAWKPAGGDKLGVVIEYLLNPAFSTEPVTLSNFVLIATYEGVKAINVQTKPTGTHVKDKSLVFWRLGDVVLEPGVSGKVLGRLLGDQGGQPLPGVVEAKWEVVVPVGRALGSKLGISRRESSGGEAKVKEADPFADEDALKSGEAGEEGEEWVKVESVRKIASGKYDALVGV